MPTNTDLVTDLPADFEVFGQAVDSSMADLKGGTTGQILSKATNTDMDFTWITNDVGDITAVTATSPLTGGGTSGAITVGIQDATTSQKGSVQLSDSTSTTSSVLAATPTAVKAAYDKASTAATTSVAGIVQLSDSTSTTSSVLASTPTATKSAYDLAASAYAAGFTNSYPAGKNRVLNSSMNVWQRGTTSADSAGNPYTADRWQLFRSNVAGATVSRQATSDTTNLPFIQYCARVQRTAANTSTNIIYFSQSIDSINSIPLSGKTVVVSYYARKGSNYSTASDALTAVLASGTGTDENIRTGFTNQAQVVGASIVLTSTWQRFTMSGTVPTNATQLGVYFYSTPVGTAGAADYYEITGVQLEVGSTASPFAPNTSTYQAELAACQRYAVELNPEGTLYPVFGSNGAVSTTQVYISARVPVTMRTAPTSVTVSGTASNYRLNSGAVQVNLTAISLDTNSTYVNAGSLLCTVASGIVANTSYSLQGNNSASAKILFSAEL